DAAGAAADLERRAAGPRAQVAEEVEVVVLSGRVPIVVAREAVEVDRLGDQSASRRRQGMKPYQRASARATISVGTCSRRMAMWIGKSASPSAIRYGQSGVHSSPWNFSPSGDSAARGSRRILPPVIAASRPRKLSSGPK